jgi:hypothetical protein
MSIVTKLRVQVADPKGLPSWQPLAHAMRNEMHIRLKWLHKAVKCSRFFMVKAEIFLSLWACIQVQGGSRNKG